jgi:ankyrin repeat protein
MNPLQIAVFAQDAKAIRALLAGGADPNAADAKNWTPLHEAATQPNPEIVSILIDAGARVNAATTSTGATPLHLAASNGFFSIVGLLLDAGANPKALDSNGRTPMDYTLEHASSITRTLFTLTQRREPEGHE